MEVGSNSLQVSNLRSRRCHYSCRLDQDQKEPKLRNRGLASKKRAAICDVHGLSGVLTRLMEIGMQVVR